MPLIPASQITLGGAQVWSEGITERFNRFGESTAEWKVVCAWNDRIKLLYALAGGSQISTGNQYSYTVSTPYPYAPSFLFWDGMEVEGIVGNGLGLLAYGTPQPVPPGSPGLVTYAAVSQSFTNNLPITGYTNARCTIKFRSLPWFEPAATGGGAPGEWNIDFSVTELTLSTNQSDPAVSGSSQTGGNPNGGVASYPVWKWEDGHTRGNPPTSQIDNSMFPTIPVPTANLSYTQYNCGAIPFSNIMNLLGKINSDTPPIYSVSSAAQQSLFSPAANTLLFAGGSARRRWIVGTPLWDITYRFMYNPLQWDHIIDPADGKFYQIENQNGNGPFGTPVAMQPLLSTFL
jgi:hypothetical protein